MLPDRFILGDLQIDLGLQRVQRGPVDIPLPKLSYDVLLSLARAAPNLVSVDELMSQVWAGLVVSPETVSQRIKLLRDALGDDPKSPRYIASLRGRGYRLLHDVSAAGKAESQPPDSMVPPPTEQSTVGSSSVTTMPADVRGARRWQTFALVLLVLAVVVLAWLAVGNWRSKQATATAAAKSIAVLPFLDMSEKKDQEYFSDGLSEELIDSLSRVPALRVPARTSSFYFKGKQATIAEIAGALRVDHVLEGSVRTSGRMLRITVQLIRVDNGAHVWSKIYDRPLDDIFKIQEEIAATVVEELKASLLPALGVRPAPTENRDAYTLYLQARALFRRGEFADYEAAYKLLQVAIGLDPKFAAAWSEIAWIRVRQFRLGIVTLNAARADAHLAIENALQLDPLLAEAHLTHGRVLYVLDWQWRKAQAEMKRAMELDPGTEDVYQWSGMIEQVFGDVDAAMAMYQQQLIRDPLAPHAYELIARLNCRAGNFADAERNAARAHVLMPQMYDDTYLARIELACGRPQLALAALENIPPAVSHALRSRVFFALGRTADADAELATVERESADRQPALIAAMHARRGDADGTFKWLERAFAVHDLDLTFIKGDSDFEAVWHDPRFIAFLQKMGMVDAATTK